MNINDDIYYEKRANIIKNRLHFVPHFNGGPAVVQSELLPGAEEPEYYTDAEVASEALAYIKYLENKVEELKAEKERILDTAEELTNAWEELKRTCRSSLEKTFKTYQKSGR